jgi:hypothetical protein
MDQWDFYLWEREMACPIYDELVLDLGFDPLWP